MNWGAMSRAERDAAFRRAAFGWLRAKSSGGTTVVSRGELTGFTFEGERIATRHTHGTGCTFAAAITAALALGQPIEQAIRGARDYVEGAIRNAPQIGGGHGPLNHFWRVY